MDFPKVVLQTPARLPGRTVELLPGEMVATTSLQLVRPGMALLAVSAAKKPHVEMLMVRRMAMQMQVSKWMECHLIGVEAMVQALVLWSGRSGSGPQDSETNCCCRSLCF